MRTAKMYEAYRAAWTQFLAAQGDPLPSNVQQQAYWWKFEVGPPGVHIAYAIKLPTREPRELTGLRVELCFRVDLLGEAEARRLHEGLRESEGLWEGSIGHELDWTSHAPNDTQYQVGVNIECDPWDEGDWPRQHRVLLDLMNRFRAHFDTTIRPEYSRA